MTLSNNAKKVLDGRYRQKKEDGTFTESHEDIFRRVAKNIAAQEPTEELKKEFEQKFFDEMSSLNWMPNTPCLMNAGTNNGLGYAACFAAGTLISTLKGDIPIEDIEVGNMVLTHTGNYKKVTQIMKRKTDKLYKLKVNKLKPIFVTGEHPIAVLDKITEIKEGNTYFDQVKNLNPGDFVIIGNPSLQATSNKVIWDKPLTENLAWLIGYWLGDGSISGLESGHGTVRFSLDYRDIDCQNKILSILKENNWVSSSGVENYITKKGTHNCEIRVHNTKLARTIVSEFGKGFGGKYINETIWSWPLEFKKALIEGIYYADGTRSNKFGKKIVLCNEGLINQLFLLLINIGYYPSSLRGRKNKLSKNPYFVVDYGNHQKHMVKVLDNKIGYSVKKIEIIDCETDVFNIEVEEDHTYVAEGLVVHNCFVVGISDSIISERGKDIIVNGNPTVSTEKSITSITDAVQACALITKTGGGIGYTLDELRPTGDWISTSKSHSGGPMGFWQVLAAMSGAMQQGGKRRGANMMTMSLWHPDILKFITAKDEFDPWMTEVLGYKARRFGNFNISVKISDTEMKNILDCPNLYFTVTNPRTQKRYFIPKSVNIKNYQLSDLYERPDTGVVQGDLDFYTYGDIWQMIVDRAHSHADPGIIFWDRVKEREMLPEGHHAISTNPCFPGDQRVLTNSGYKTFKELLNKSNIDIVQDTRIKYIGPEKDNNDPKYWIINNTKPSTKIVKSEIGVFLSAKNKNILKISTKSGLSIRCTEDHHLAVKERGFVEAKNIKPGDRILVAKNNKEININNNSYEYKLGLITGLVKGDGCIYQKNLDNPNLTTRISCWNNDQEILENTIENIVQEIFQKEIDLHQWTNNSTRKIKNAYYKVTSDTKTSIDGVFLTRVFEKYSLFINCKEKEVNLNSMNLDAFIGFLTGLFFTDGTVQINKNGNSIRISNNDKKLLSDIQIKLLEYGVFAKVYKRRNEHVKLMPNGNNGQKEYNCKEQFELIIQGHSGKKLGDLICTLGNKKDSYLSIVNTFKKDNRWDTEVTNIEPDGIEDVYCISENNHNRTIVVEGLTVRRCGEVPLQSHSVCNLGSINLANFVQKNRTINWDGLHDSWINLIRFLDNVIDASPYPTHDIDLEAKRWRRIGAGVMGFADMLFKMEIPYNSEQAFGLAKEIGDKLRSWAISSSRDLFNKKGTSVDWLSHQLKVSDDPLTRNAYLTCVAPTGTISIIANTSASIEPLYALVLKRQVMRDHTGKAADTELEVNEHFKAYLNNNFRSIANQIIEFAANNGGSIKNLTTLDLIKMYDSDGISKISLNVNDERLTIELNILKSIFVTSMDISWQDHTKMQAAWTNSLTAPGYTQSISKTVNMQSSATKEDVRDFYQMAWELGCIGTTMYRDGSHDGQPMTTEKKSETKESVEVIIDELPDIKPFPKSSQVTKSKFNAKEAVILSTRTSVGNLRLVVGFDQNKPTETFVIASKQGTDVASMCDALGRTISISLQNGVPKEKIVETLKNISGGTPSMSNGITIKSIPDAISQMLDSLEFSSAPTDKIQKEIQEIKQTLAIKKEYTGNFCPDCGSNLEFSSGCKGGLCNNCGFSSC